MNFKKLVDLREANNLYQKDIAKVIGVSQQTYSLWETGNKIIPLKHLNTLANYYRVSIDYLLGLTNKKIYYQSIASLNKKKIGQNLKTIREKYNLTMRELANILNTTSSTISAYESGKTLILTVFAFQICQRYNLSMDIFLGRVKTEKTKSMV